LQSQPNRIEVVCEKNTIYHMVLKVTEKYQIPTSSGRGFNSIDPWHDLYERYVDSGKDKLIVIVLSDFDPEGEMIPQAGGRTLRDDFGVDEDSPGVSTGRSASSIATSAAAGSRTFPPGPGSGFRTQGSPWPSRSASWPATWTATVGRISWWPTTALVISSSIT
jgi:hypothetical protein